MQVPLPVFILVCAVLLAALGHARARIRQMNEAVQLAAYRAAVLEQAFQELKAVLLATAAPASKVN